MRVSCSGGYKAGGQRAVRDGDWKYLRITGNEFRFDVVKDPRERANLKGIFARLDRKLASPGLADAANEAAA
jgi:hypothetical protein